MMHRKCNVTKGIDPKTKLPADAPTNPANDSGRRRLLDREVTTAEETHIGLHETVTKYATQETDAFGKKDIR